MLHTIFGGKCHFVMAGHLCLTIYKMDDLWKVVRHINKSETWHSSRRCPLLIPKFWWPINFLNIAKKLLSKNSLVLSNYDIWPKYKRYSYVPSSVSSHLDPTMDLPLQLTIQKNSLECHLNVSFQFITIKIEIFNHDNDASVETVQILKIPLECPNVVVIWKWWLFISDENMSD